MPGKMPEHLQHVVSSEDRLHADVPNARPLQVNGTSDSSLETWPDEEAKFEAADEERLVIAAAMLVSACSS